MDGGTEVTTRAANADPLLQPFRIKGLLLRNRVMSTSHAIALHEKARPTLRYQLYHEEKAKGGIALTMFGGSSNVAPDSATVFGQLHVGHDDVIPYFQEFSARIHAHGAALMCQITHLGGRTHWRADHWLPVLAPSRSREKLHRAIAKEMDEQDIDRVVHAFGQAARRCREGGLDGLEVMASGHLLGQFWSRRINRRADAYGGSLENRCRFGLRVFEEIRRQAGPDFVVGLRMSMGLFGEQGLSAADEEENAEIHRIARIYARSGLIDFLNLNFSRNDTEIGLARAMPGMEVPVAPYLHKVAAFREGLDLPVFHACRVIDVASARYAVREGIVDMIGMTREHIADPHIVNKIRRGEEDRIRPCVGATYCSWHTRCIHNPSTGQEARYPHEIAPAPERKKVVVVGAGPGGLEAARVSAERGHEVVVFEAASRPGGQLRLAARVPSRRDMSGIVDWRVAEAERLGVRFHFNTYADAGAVLVEAPDYVVVATGGTPDRLEDELPGAALCGTVTEAFEDPGRYAGTVLLFDGTGTINAASCAELLLDGPATRLVYVSPDRAALQETAGMSRPFQMRRLYEGGAEIIADHRLAAVRRQGNGLVATLANELTGAEREVGCDAVLLEHGTVPASELYDALRDISSNLGVTDVDAIAAGKPQPEVTNPEGRFLLHRVGDAVASRDAYAAILDAFRLCRDF
jgi:2,4-dienoyl-CoA reductase-like NADH-dependent reductase (Old Yellow Enzyme family)/thioredoxin reductase